MNFTSFGLGDSSYAQYNVVHRLLHGRFLQLGAQLFCSRGEGNEQHPEGFSGGFREWIVDLKEALLQHFALPDGEDVIGSNVFLPPKWKLSIADRSANAHQEANGMNVNGLSAETPPNHDLIPVKNSLTANLAENPRITPESHSQDVRLMHLQLEESVEYGPGAVAVIYPKNFPQDVNDFLGAMNWEDMADVPLNLVSSGLVTDPKHSTPSPLRHINLEDYQLTLRTLLTDHLDILSVPRRSFFASLAYFAKSGNEDESYQQERILELANPELIDELWDYTSRPRRTILEVMPDFPSIQIPWQYALSILPIMRGRQFSIASGGRLVHRCASGTNVQLLVAIANPPNPIIKYRKRFGVCTRYIASLQAGQKINIEIQPGYLNVKPEEIHAPVLLIGPGTGVAPLRSMIYQRLAWAEEDSSTDGSQALSETFLFFGNRNVDADYFFSNEWKRIETQGLKVFAGFSRDQGQPRTYVQDLLQQQSAVVFDMLDRRCGKVYVCGSSGNMPKGVRQALIDILRDEGGITEDEAELYLARLEKAGRYKQETW